MIDDAGEERGEGPADLRIAFARLCIRVEKLEGHVNTTLARNEAVGAKNETAIERLQASMAQFGREAAERENRHANRLTFMLLGVAGLVIAATGLLLAILGGGR